MNFDTPYLQNGISMCVFMWPLTHLSLASLLWDIGKQHIAPDVTPQNAASHPGLFCLLREISSII